MRSRSLLALAPMLALATMLEAQTVVVTGPGTTYTNPAPASIDDASCAAAPNTWCARNVRNSGAVGITSTLAQSGNGSLEFSGPGTSANPTTYKADFEYYLSSSFKLNTLSTLGYDFYRFASSTTQAHFVPSLRLVLTDANNVYAGYLVYEPALNGTPTNAVFPQPTNAWQTVSIDGSGAFWWTKEGTQLAYALSDWQSGRSTSAGTLDGNFNVIGFSTGIGSGWQGSYAGAVDNINYRTASMNESVNFNFEVAGTSTVPEPSTYALMAAGLAGLGLVARRRRTNA